VIAGGAVLGWLLVVVAALVGGVDGKPDGSREDGPTRLGPATAIQPELRKALLTDRDLPPVAGGDRAGPRPEPPTDPAPVTTPAPPARAPATETGALVDLCRALFEDPAKLAGLWRTPPQEVASRHTTRPSGAILHQVLGVFGLERSVDAYRLLRESAANCGSFEGTLEDGTPVAALLEGLIARRPESAPADESYATILTSEDGAVEGWLTVDRVGPIVSVLRYRGPDPSYEEYELLAEARDTALNKLRPLLQTLQLGAG
jgi:hypothetical protein